MDAADDRGDFVLEQEVGEFVKNAQEVVKGALTQAYGRPCADIRVYYLTATRERKPTPKGICMSRDRLPELRDLIEKLIAACGNGHGADAEDAQDSDDEDEVRSEAKHDHHVEES